MGRVEVFPSGSQGRVGQWGPAVGTPVENLFRLCGEAEFALEGALTPMKPLKLGSLLVRGKGSLGRN